MKAIGYNQAGPITASEALIEFETGIPEIGPQDLLVEVRGISVNPVDVKVRANMGPKKGTKVIGYDAAGIVREVGSDVSKFKAGDEVFYAVILPGQVQTPSFMPLMSALSGRSLNPWTLPNQPRFP